MIARAFSAESASIPSLARSLRLANPAGSNFLYDGCRKRARGERPQDEEGKGKGKGEEDFPDNLPQAIKYPKRSSQNPHKTEHFTSGRFY